MMIHQIKSQRQVEFCKQYMTNSCNKKKSINNEGFSIVELIVAVAILAAVFAPVLKSFTTAAITNSRAQRTQNATSVAEDIMESVKGTKISDLYDEAINSGKQIGDLNINKDKILFLSGDDATGYLSGGTYSSDSADYLNPPYVISYEDVTATQGRTYNVQVKIDAGAYNQSSTDASNINSVALPQLYDIQDSKDHAVLSWEMSKYDSSALNNLAEENAQRDSEIASIKSLISSKCKKTTTITISDAGGDNVNVSCDIKYESGESSYPKELLYNVYSGHLKTLPVNEKSNGGPHIYLFYVMSAIGNTEYIPHEIINVQDNTTSGVHNVYLMLQNDGNINDLKYSNGAKIADLELQYKGSTIVKRLNDAYKLTKTKWNKDDLSSFGDSTFYTNLTGVNVEQGQLFDVKKKNRLYEVVVTVLNEDNSRAAELTSTMTTGEESD